MYQSNGTWNIKVNEKTLSILDLSDDIRSAIINLFEEKQIILFESLPDGFRFENQCDVDSISLNIIYVVAASDRDGVMFALPAGNCGDAPEGRALLRRLGPVNQPVYLLMDRAYEGDDTRALAAELGYIPVVPPKSNRKNPWDYDKQLYRQRNQVERLFRRLKRFRRIFTRYDKLDVVFLSFVYFALIVDALM